MLLYRRRSPAAGKPRWGFKEVRCDAGHARLLIEAFPDGCIVFLLRDPVSIIASMRGASGYESWYEYAGGARGVLARWPRTLVEDLGALPARVSRAVKRRLPNL